MGQGVQNCYYVGGGVHDYDIHDYDGNDGQMTDRLLQDV